MSDTGTPVSVRMDAELLQGLRALAAERSESLSDVIRRAALQLLGYCPTCGQQVTAEHTEAS